MYSVIGGKKRERHRKNVEVGGRVDFGFERGEPSVSRQPVHMCACVNFAVRLLLLSTVLSIYFSLNKFLYQVLPGFVIKKGMRVEMPMYSSHHNEEFFPDPEEFRPERFLKENAKDILPYTFRPFGGS